MFELILRLCIAASVAYFSRETGTPPFEWAFPITIAYGFWAIGCTLVARRWEPLGSSLVTMADVAAVGVFAGASGALNTFGFLAAIPAVYAISRRSAHPLVASAAGLSMYLGFMLFAKGVPALDFHFKALAITLAAGVAIPKTTRRVSLAEPSTDDQTLTVTLAAPMTNDESLSEELELLRATNERLAERQRRIEDQIRRDAAVKELVGARPESITELANIVAHVTESEAVAIYVRSESADDIVIQGASGTWPRALRDTAIPIMPGETPEGMRWAIEAQVSGLLDEGHHSTVLLTQADRLIGLAVVRHDQAHDANLDEIADIITTMVVEIAEKRRTRNRLRESEIQYAVASITQGATTKSSLAERVVRELSTLVEADGLSIVWTEDHESTVAAQSGAEFDIAPVLSLKHGPGVDGWLATGAPEIAAFRTMSDPHCSPAEAMQSRIGSFIMIPLQSGHHPFGFLLAATHRSGGLDTADLLSLRTLGIEISRSIARLDQAPIEEGLVTPTEFHELTRVGGAIVYIEPLNSSGDAIRQFAHIVRGKLPATGIVCRRDQDDLLAFLSGYSHKQAVSWANEIQALASMISAGNRPLAVRTKVAYLPNRVISAA